MCEYNLLAINPSTHKQDKLNFHVLLWPLLQESYPSTPPIWFVDSDDPSLAEVLERLEDVRKGSTLVSWLMSHMFSAITVEAW